MIAGVKKLHKMRILRAGANSWGVLRIAYCVKAKLRDGFGLGSIWGDGVILRAFKGAFLSGLERILRGFARVLNGFLQKLRGFGRIQDTRFKARR